MSFLSAWLQNAGWTAILDILLVALLVYYLMMLSKRTRAWYIIWGLMIFLALVFLTDRMQLHTLNFILQTFVPLGPVAIVILFLPEIRQWLESMGRVAGWGRGLSAMPREDVSTLIQVISRSAVNMSERRIGALMVIEREGSLDDIASTGTGMDAVVSEELIGSIFNPGSPLHDGAIVVRGTRIVAAGCTLPLSESAHVGTMIHTRHKAALGVAEESDAAVVVVSEETGTISLALEGKLHRGLNEETLMQWLRVISGASDERNRRSDIARKVNGTLRKARLRLR